jgi:hypothetical protein
MTLSLSLFAVACGGKDKPPLTPDQDNALLDAGADPSAAPTTTPPAK